MGMFASMLFSTVLSKLMEPDLPEAPDLKKKSVAPTPDDEESKKSTQRMLAKKGATQGRQSTFLTGGSNTLG